MDRVRMRWPARRRARGSGPSGTPATSGFLGDLLEVFQPSRRHVVEEQERRRDHVQLPGSGAPPVVDLDRGIVHLPPPASDPEPPPEPPARPSLAPPVQPGGPSTSPDRRSG